MPAPVTADQTAVLLIAHGSRRAAANDDLRRLAELLVQQGPYRVVEVSFLELTEPTIAAGGAACAARDVRRVLMLPYFLSAGVHVEQDLAEQQRALQQRFPDVEFVLCAPLGLHPLLLQIVLDRLREAERG